MRKALILAAAMTAIALGGCSKKTDADADGDGKITQAEAQAAMAKGGEVKLKPGQWEVTMTATEFDMPGMDERMKEMMKAQVSRSQTVKQCLTAEQVERPNTDMFGGDKSCSYDKFERSGSNVSMAMTCSPQGGGTMKSQADGQITPESYSMKTQMTMTGSAAGNISMKGEISGRRVGDCPA